MNARLEAVEARLETRLVSMDSKMDTLLSEIRHVGESAKADILFVAQLPTAKSVRTGFPKKPQGVGSLAKGKAATSATLQYASLDWPTSAAT